MTKAVDLDCNRPADRKEIGKILRNMRKDKMSDYKLSVREFVEWFEVDPVGALSHLLVEIIKPIHIDRIKQYQITPEEIYNRHANNKDVHLFGLYI